MTDAIRRAAIERHWAASQAGDEAAEQAIYADEAVLEYPQSGERFRGRRNIQGQRGHHPARREFVVRRVRGSGKVWITELVITYDGKPYDTVEHHGVSRGPRRARDAVLRRAHCSRCLAGAMG